MSTSRNILSLLDGHTATFSNRFSFYLDATDDLFSLQGQMGLDVAAMERLPEHDQNLIKTYLFLVESGNTTWAAAFRLLSSGFIADAYGLIRILYETAALLHYGNSAPSDTRTELHRTMFKSDLPETEHRKQEWVFTRKATRLIEIDSPGLVPVHQELNNFGGHISRAKVVLGNVTALGNASASRVFTPDWSNNRYLAGLDFLFTVSTLILEEYAKLQKTYDGISPEVKARVNGLAARFASSVRPKLQAMMKANQASTRF
jgi:hypothetical protein